MKPLVLTSEPPPSFTRGGFPDVAIELTIFRFVWGPLPSRDEIAGVLGPSASIHGASGARGFSLTEDIFNNSNIRQTYVFDEVEYGNLLDGLAFGPTPAVVGLDEELRTMRRDNWRDREGAYKRSRLSLTEFGKAVVAHKEDFSRDNPIDRWWGGTHLTNDNLWRWSPGLVKP